MPGRRDPDRRRADGDRARSPATTARSGCAGRSCSRATSTRRSTRTRFDADGFFRTGDLGRLDADGYLVITGRLKDIIIRKGENISAKEVEDILYAHPRIADVAVDRAARSRAR